MIAALYARVSTDKQEEQNQLPVLRELAKRCGYLVYKEYTDIASGCDGNRPGWQELLGDARQGGFNVVLVVKLDRVMRSVIHLLNVLDLLDKYHVIIQCADIGVLDIHSPATKLQIEILGSVAEWERTIIRERTIAALEEKRRQGVILGRPSKKRIDLNTAARLRLSGHTIKQVAQKLNCSESDINNRRHEIRAIMEELKKEDD